MLTPETITSSANPLLKDVRRTVSRGGLTTDGWCIAESPHLLEEALRSHCNIRAVLAADSKLPTLDAFAARLAGVKIIALPDSLFDTIAATETSQGIMALVQPPEWKIQDLFRGRALVVILDAIQDPGNAGTIVRAAEAFGATGILFLKGSASPHNPKTLRASAGSLFRVPFQHNVATATALATLRQNGIQIFATLPDGPATPLADINLTARCALVIGNEAHGVTPEWRAAAAALTIPTAGVESLNAAMAAAVLLYEARRQRMLQP